MMMQVKALYQAGIEYVPILDGACDLIAEQMMLNYIQQDIILNSIKDYTAYEKLIRSLMREHITITQKQLLEAQLQTIKDLKILEKIVPQLDEALYTQTSSIENYIQGIYEEGKKEGFTNMQVQKFVGRSDMQALFNLNNYNFDLIKNMSNDLKAAIQKEIMQGVILDESPVQIAKRLDKLDINPIKAGNRILSSKERVRMIARTESARTRNTGLLTSFKQYGVEYKNVVNTPWKQLCSDCKEKAAKNPYKIDDPQGNPPFILNVTVE